MFVCLRGSTLLTAISPPFLLTQDRVSYEHGLCLTDATDQVITPAYARDDLEPGTFHAHFTPPSCFLSPWLFTLGLIVQFSLALSL